MKIAFLYGGQGSQQENMGKDLYETYPIVKQLYDNAHLDFDLKKISFSADINTLSQTAYTQPCMVAFGAAVTGILKENAIVPVMAAGLSIGEYSALNCAGVFTDSDVLKIAHLRGKAMEAAVQGKKTTMVAVMGLLENKVDEICKMVSGSEIVSKANLNCPGQIVIGGGINAVNEAVEKLKEAGARRCIPLKVSGAFHTAYMQAASEELKEIFKEIVFFPMRIPIVFNTSGNLLKEDENIKDILVKQVKSPVYFEKSIRKMIENGVDTFIEIGFGKTITGFIKKIDKNVVVYEANNVKTINALIETLKYNIEEINRENKNGTYR